MVKKAMRSIATLLHAQVPPTAAFRSMCSVLTLIEIEIEAQPAIVIVHSNTSFVLQLCRQDVCNLFPLSFSFALSFAL